MAKKIEELKKELIYIHDLPKAEMTMDHKKRIKEIIKEMKELSEIKEKIQEGYEIRDILNTIKIINEEYSKAGGYKYLSFFDGGCYKFAQMLNEIYPEGEKYTSTCGEIHAILKIGNHFYDADGIFNYKDEYKYADEENFNFFIDLCFMHRNRLNKEKYDELCNKVVENVKERVKNNPKTPVL